MNCVKSKPLVLAFLSVALLLVCHPAALHAQSEAGIVALVNDEPISSYDVSMRIGLAVKMNDKTAVQLAQANLKQRFSDPAKLTARFKEWASKQNVQIRSQQDVKALQGKFISSIRDDALGSVKSDKSFRKAILEQLINEKIQLQAASKLGVVLGEEDVDDVLTRLAAANKNKETGKALTKDEFVRNLEKTGIPLNGFRNYWKAKLSWRRVVARKFQYQVNIGDQEVDRLISAEDDGNSKLQTLYTVQRLSLPVSVSASEATKAEMFAEAESLRQSVKSCSQLKDAADRFSGAEVKSLGSKTADSFPNAMQAYLAQMSDGELSPPTVTSSGVELYVVCERKQKKVADLSKRDEVKDKLRNEELEILGKRYMQDLRLEASVEYR
jgi:peptidyl-prolyl cis-trans isomerase SurA